MPKEGYNVPFFKKPPQALFKRGVSPKGDHDLENPVFIFRHSFNSWWRETLKRQRGYLGMAQSVKGENIFNHAIEGFYFAHIMDIADRAANGLRINLIFSNQNSEANNKSKFGLMVNYGYNNPEFTDHNHPHLRRVERFIEAMLLNIGDLRHSQSVAEYIDPLLLYANFHDLAQIYNLQHNSTYPREKIPNVKKAHGLEAAIMLLALHRRYAIERKITNHDAWKKSAIAAAMIMIHDAPEKFMKILDSNISAADLVKGLSDEEKISKLAEIFDSEKETICNVTTIAPSDLLKILALVKGKDLEDKSYGLPAQFVQEYEKEIKDLEANNAPLLQYEDVNFEGLTVLKAGIPEEDKEAFKLAAEVALMADLLDMRIPGEESIFRTLRTQRSRDRKFFPEENLTYKEVKDIIFGGSGEIPSNSPFFSDVIRILWESANMEKLINGLDENNVLVKSDYLKRMIRDASITSVLSLQIIGNRLLNRDFQAVGEVFSRRKLALMKKAERRKNSDIDISERLEEEISNLKLEENGILDNLKRKIPTAYTDQQISVFNELINHVLKELFVRYQITHREEVKYRKLVMAHHLPKSLPYQSYESLGIYPPRTLVEPIGLMTIATIKEALGQEPTY